MSDDIKSMIPVSLTGKQMTARNWLMTNSAKLATAAMISVGLFVAALGVGVAWDGLGEEQAREYPVGLKESDVPAEARGEYPIVDQSGSTPYKPLILLGAIPAGLYGASVYGKRFAKTTTDVVYVERSNITDFETFTTKRDNYSPLDPVWIGAVQVCGQVKDELSELLQSMDGPFTSSMAGCVAIASRLEVHTGQTYKYLHPALRLKNAHNNPSLAKATEEMVLDVRLLQELRDVCTQLYVQSHFDSGHNTILNNEIVRITQQIDAVREASGNELPTAGATKGNMITTGSDDTLIDDVAGAFDRTIKTKDERIAEFQKQKA